MKKIAQGAEAVLYLRDNIIVKHRVKKGYRHEELDLKIRKRCTKTEAKILEKAFKLIPVPKLHKTNDREMIIEMEFIEGEKLRDILDNHKQRKELCRQIGENIAKLHKAEIIHGDLTTSNMILKEVLYFIDFGLSFFSTKIEDKAVDLHLLRQALESKHHKHAAESFKEVMKGYKAENPEHLEIIHRLELVEKRGRYKSKK
ncbi:Kae1-associated serine/threonine protein kinase [Candidatus Woesearchaeota archaeon]|nr:Kae1-associated serine/threonine protein kinase [Candidatus Woesearchaeota archaeon]